MGIALSMILAGVLPMPIVFLMRSFQCLKVDLDIHQGSIRRNETTASTKEMIDNDDDVSTSLISIIRRVIPNVIKTKIFFKESMYENTLYVSIRRLLFYI